MIPHKWENGCGHSSNDLLLLDIVHQKEETRSFAAKQSVCKMSGSAVRDKCAVGLTPGLTRNHSFQGLVSQSRVRATVTSKHQGRRALRSPQSLFWGDGDSAFSLSSPPVKPFVLGKPKPKRLTKILVNTAWVENPL